MAGWKCRIWIVPWPPGMGNSFYKLGLVLAASHPPIRSTFLLQRCQNRNTLQIGLGRKMIHNVAAINSRRFTLPSRPPYITLARRYPSPPRASLEQDLVDWLGDNNIKMYALSWQRWSHHLDETRCIEFLRTTIVFPYMKDALRYKLAWSGKL